MASVLLGLSSFVLPGLPHALLGRWKLMALWLGLFAGSFVLLAWTVWGLPAMLAVLVASSIDAIIRLRRMPPPLRMTGVFAAIPPVAVLVIALGARMFVVEAFKIPSSAMIPTLEIGDHIFINKLRTSPSRGDVIVFAQPCQPDRDYIKRVIGLGGDTIEQRCNVLYINGKAVPSELVAAATTYKDRDEERGQSFERAASRYRETIDGTTFDILHDDEQPKRAAGPVTERPTMKDFPDEIARGCANQLDMSSEATDQPQGKIVVTREPTPDTACEPYRHFVVPAGTVFVMGDNRPNSNDSRYWGVVPVGHIKGTVTGIWLPFGRYGKL
ncbi:MAG TPA: signal peptidase I [Kofleriaceae bacterium]|nr:signal peptidase I [Kofleriaceae bacterium]